MSSKTIDGMPRELLERIAQWGSVTWMDKNELRAFLAAPVVERQEPIAQLAALKAARQFIVNGTELGFIRMPEAETPDPAHDTLLMIERAIAELEAGADEGGVQFRMAKGAEVITGTVEIRDEFSLTEVVDAMLEAAFPLTVAAIARPDQPRIAVAFDFPPLPEGMSTSFREFMESGVGNPGPKFTISGGRLELLPAPVALTNESSIQTDHDRLVRELDVLLNGEAGAAEQASLCDIVAQVRWARKNPGTGPLQLLALVPDQVVGRVHRAEDVPDQAHGELNSCGRGLPEGAPLYTRPADTLKRYVRAPSRKDPKYHEEWPEIEGGPVFDGVTYCKDLFEALKRFNVIVAETMPEGAVDE